MLNQFSDLIGLNRNEPFVASMLPIFLLENDAGDSTHFSFFGGDAFPRGGAWDGEYSLGVFRVGLGEAFEVGQWKWR